MKIKVLELLASASAKKDNRIFLNGIAITRDCIVASNGHVLANFKPRYYSDIQSVFENDTIPINDEQNAFIIPIESVTLFLKQAKTTYGKKYADYCFQIVQFESNWILKTGNVSVIFERINAKYPNFKKALCAVFESGSVKSSYDAIYLANAQIALNMYLNRKKERGFLMYEESANGNGLLYQAIDDDENELKYLIMPTRV